MKFNEFFTKQLNGCELFISRQILEFFLEPFSGCWAILQKVRFCF